MSAEGTGRGELTQLVPYHILRNVNRNELVPVVNGDRVTDEIGRNHRSPGPSLYHGFLIRFVHGENLLLKFHAYERAFF